MKPEIRNKYIRKTFENAKADLTQASSFLENTFCELLPDIDEFPEFEELALKSQSLYLKSQDLLGEFIETLKKHQ